jgi:16S rRNA (uracil1498-N3)-methyltransferase
MIRIFLNLDKIYLKQIIAIQDQNFNYLKNVMRVKIFDKINIFNGKDGDFLAEIIKIDKKRCQIAILELIKKQYFPPNISLAFSLTKNNTLESIAKRAVEMGVTKFLPIITKNSYINKFNENKFKINIKEGCEQSERNDIAKLEKLEKLNNFLDNIPDNTILILCDESGRSKKASLVLQDIPQDFQEIIILIGPEGGFSENELEQIKLKTIYSISLGPRILRVDTAAIAALALIEENFGDWK